LIVDDEDEDTNKTWKVVYK